jgi:acyl carrier protein phosphodiesterase
VNLLAHLHLSANCPPEVLTANVLADYLGRCDPVDRLPPHLTSILMPGVILHRQIDSFTDRHPGVAKARELISSDLRRLAGIIVDVAFDYFLTRHWEKFSQEAPETMISRSYATMAMVAANVFSRETQSLVSKMRTHNWLKAYGTLEGQALTFQRISRRSPAVAKLAGAEKEIVANDRELDDCFLNFYPDLIDHAAQWRKEHLPGTLHLP